LRELDLGNYNLLVLGVSPRPGEELSFGQVAAELLDRAECSVLFVASEPITANPEKSNSPERFSSPVAQPA
jgi:hypothetical protein